MSAPHFGRTTAPTTEEIAAHQYRRRIAWLIRHRNENGNTYLCVVRLAVMDGAPCWSTLGAPTVRGGWSYAGMQTMHSGLPAAEWWCPLDDDGAPTDWPGTGNA